MKLVDDWRDAWKWLSMNCMVLATAIQGTWIAIPDNMRSTIPANWVHALTIALLIAGVGGRLIKQGSNNAADPPV